VFNDKNILITGGTGSFGKNIRSVRPGFGLHPKYLKDIIGTEAEKDYAYGEAFRGDNQ